MDMFEFTNHFYSEEFGKDDKFFEPYIEFLPQNVSKTRYSHPYSYDPFLIFFNDRAKKKANNTIYTDRLLQWDYEKHNELCEKHFGNRGERWDKRSPSDIEDFLIDYLGKNVILVANIQYVHLGSGFPLWRLDFYEAPEGEK